MGKNLAHTQNPKQTPINWSPRHPESITKNWVQNKSQKIEKWLKNEVIFLIEKHLYIRLLNQIPQKYNIIIRIQIYQRVPQLK